MSTEAMLTPAKRPGAFVRLFPFIVLAIAAAVLSTAWKYPGNSLDESSRSMIKIFTIFISFATILVWALRKSGWRKRTVWLSALLVIGLPMFIWKPTSMSGRFFPIFVERNWVQDLFMGGSAETLLKKHRQQQGKVEGPADLSVREGDVPDYRGTNRDGIVIGPKLERDWSKNPPKEIWRQPVGGGYASFVSANGFLVTIEQRRDPDEGWDREVVTCYEAASGKEVWSAGWDARFSERLGGDGPRATPTIAHGDVFAFGAKGRLVCLDGRDGKERWAVETLEGNKNLMWGMSGSPLVVDDLVIVNPGAQTPEAHGTAIRAYNRTTGQLKWQTGSSATAYSSPQLGTLNGVRQVLIFDAYGLSGLEPATGKLLWRTDWKTDYDINVAQPLVVSDDTVMIASGYHKGGSLVRITKEGETWKAAQAWRTKNKSLLYKFTSGVRSKSAERDFVYGLNEGILECVDLKTGRQVWQDERRAKAGEAFGHGQILLCDDLIVVLTEYGELVLVEATPAEFKELGRIQALTKGPKTWNVPTMVGGKIYIRNEEEMACYDLTGK